MTIFTSYYYFLFCILLIFCSSMLCYWNKVEKIMLIRIYFLEKCHFENRHFLKMTHICIYTALIKQVKIKSPRSHILVIVIVVKANKVGDWGVGVLEAAMSAPPPSALKHLGTTSWCQSLTITLYLDGIFLIWLKILFCRFALFNIFIYFFSLFFVVAFLQMVCKHLWPCVH